MEIKYPEIEVKLVGNDGNAYAILGSMKRELQRGAVPQVEIKEFMDEAMSGDYNHLLRTCMNWVTVL